MIWWACTRVVLVTLDAVRKDSAAPDEANPASTMALVDPLSSSRVPSDFSRHFDMESPKHYDKLVLSILWPLPLDLFQ